MNEQKPSIPITSPDESPRSPYGYNERYIHSETTEIGEFTDTLNSDRVKLESSFFSVKHRWQTGDGQPDVRHTTTDITHFGISIITLTQNNTILIYHDGRIYKPINQYWIDNLADDLKQGHPATYLPNALALADFTTHSLGDYLVDYWKTLRDGYNIITYCQTCQLGKVADLLSRYPFAFRNYRVTRQQHLTAFGVPYTGDEVLLMYNGMYCTYDYRDNLLEITSSGLFNDAHKGPGGVADTDDKLADGAQTVIPIDNNTAFFWFVAGALRLFFGHKREGFTLTVPDVLLDAFPLDFGLCKAHPDSRIALDHVLLPAFSIINLSNKMSFTLAECDELYAGISTDMRPLDLRRRFGSQPTHVTVKVEIDTRGNINIIATDDDNPNQSFSVEYMYLRKAKN